jgi:hypothetical protein
MDNVLLIKVLFVSRKISTSLRIMIYFVDASAKTYTVNSINSELIW